mmetsp:Transcript_77935/g.152495  ORF Transcript_77935/g.152495 Transcript_77935/m.152495 type:complete len:344 (-) Transcript_77935:151-1182(-)
MEQLGSLPNRGLALPPERARLVVVLAVSVGGAVGHVVPPLVVRAARVGPHHLSVGGAARVPRLVAQKLVGFAQARPFALAELARRLKREHARALPPNLRAAAHVAPPKQCGVVFPAELRARQRRALGDLGGEQGGLVGRGRGGRLRRELARQKAGVGGWFHGGDVGGDPRIGRRVVRGGRAGLRGGQRGWVVGGWARRVCRGRRRGGVGGVVGWSGGRVGRVDRFEGGGAVRAVRGERRGLLGGQARRGVGGPRGRPLGRLLRGQVRGSVGWGVGGARRGFFGRFGARQGSWAVWRWQRCGGWRRGLTCRRAGREVGWCGRRFNRRLGADARGRRLPLESRLR